MDCITICKNINGFKRYLIDENGNVYDIKRDKSVCKWIDTVGYYQCNLRDDNNKKYYKRVHRLVAQSYIPNPNNFPQVNHKDGNKLNNNVENLEWTTNSQNVQHGYDNNLYKFKSRSHEIKVISKNDNSVKHYPSIRNMCEDLKINRKTVTMILKGEKDTNNYNYSFEYVEEDQSTIESVSRSII